MWVDPVYRTVCDRVWCPAEYRTVCDRVWREPLVQDRCERVWIEPIYEVRTVVRYDSCGRRIICRERCQVAPGHWEERHRQVVVSPAHWDAIERQELVSDAHWKTIERQELVTPGHWEERIVSAPAPTPPWWNHDHYDRGDRYRG